MDKIILEAKNLSKNFGALRACDTINLEVRAGEIHALIGPNGAGKSTLMKLLSGEMMPDQGDIALLGKSLTDQSATKRARLGMARTFQVSALMPEMTALQNAMLALIGQQGAVFSFFKKVMHEKPLKDKAIAALSQVDLGSRANMRTDELSHGERRRLEIALALCMKPKVFLMDEPMAGLGPEGSATLTKTLSGLRNQAPILLVEHDMDAVFQLADRISVLVYGQIIASGTPDEIRHDKAVREAYLGDDAFDAVPL